MEYWLNCVKVCEIILSVILTINMLKSIRQDIVKFCMPFNLRLSFSLLSKLKKSKIKRYWWHNYHWSGRQKQRKNLYTWLWISPLRLGLLSMELHVSTILCTWFFADNMKQTWTICFETNLYDIRGKQLVYSVQTKSEDPSNVYVWLTIIQDQL